MPSAISHAVVSVAAGMTFAPRDVSDRFWSLSLICSVIPDADVIAFSFGIPYQHLFGHRGFFHSPFFGLLTSIFIVSVFFRDIKIFSSQWVFYFIFFSYRRVMASSMASRMEAWELLYCLPLIRQGIFSRGGQFWFHRLVLPTFLADGA